MLEIGVLIFAAWCAAGIVLTLACHSYSGYTGIESISAAVKEIYTCIKYKSLEHGITEPALKKLRAIYFVYKASSLALSAFFALLVIGVIYVAIT